MPRKPREPKRKRLAAVVPPPPFLQLMPGGRMRIDPTVVRQLTAWIAAYADRYASVASKTLRGLRGRERAQRLASRRAAEAAYNVLFLFAAGLTDTLDVRLIDNALAEWDKCFAVDPEHHIIPFTPSIPGTT